MKVQKMVFLPTATNAALKEYCKTTNFSQSQVMRGSIEKFLVDAGILADYSPIASPGRPPIIGGENNV